MNEVSMDDNEEIRGMADEDPSSKAAGVDKDVMRAQMI